MSENTTPSSPSVAAVPPVKMNAARPAPPAAPQKSGGRVWFKDSKTGGSKKAAD